MRMGKRKTTAVLKAISSDHTISPEMEPNNLTLTPISSPKASASSSYQKAVCLEEWWLVKSETDCDGKRLAVGGLTSKRQQAVRVFVSSPIVKRHDSFNLETADGITVVIQSLINRSRTHQNGFPPEACSKFLMGFPYNWEVYANQYFGEQSITQNAPISGSCFSELTKPSAEDGTSVSRICFDEIPMTRLLECLISTHGNFGGNLITRSLFATMVVRISDDSGDATVQKDLHINISNSSLKGISKQDKARTLPETINTYKMHDNGTGNVSGEFEANFAEGKVEHRNATDTKNGGPEEHGKALPSKQKDNINHGSCDKPENDVIGKTTLLGKSESPHPNASKDTLQVAADGTNATPSKKKSTVKESLSKVEPRRSSRRLKNLNNDSNGEEKAIGSIGVEIGKVSTISMPAPHNFGPEARILRRSSRRLNNLNNNSKEEKMAIGRIGVEIGKVSTISMPALHNFGPEARIEESFSMEGDDLHLECTRAPERGFFPGESVQGSDVKKNAKNFKKSKKIAIQSKEMDTSDATMSNSVTRRSRSRLKKSSSNLKEDQTVEYCLETERHEVGTLLENHDLESNGINPVEHILHEISALDPDKVSLREQMPAVSSDCLSSQGGVEPFDQNGYFGSSVEHYDTAGDSNIGVEGQQSNDKAKAKSRKKRKSVAVSQPASTQNRAKKLSIVTPESFKRSRSGRVLVPALATWRNEQIIYDMDGGISGIALAYNESPSAAGSKSKSLRKREKH